MCFGVKSSNDRVAESKIIALCTKNGKETRSAHVGRSGNKKCHNEDNWKNCCFSCQNSSKKFPVYRTQIQSGHWQKDEWRQGKRSHKMFNPLASVIEMIFSLPAIYLLIIDKINISHFWNITYIILITHPQSITAKHCISAGYKFSKARSSSSSVVLNISWVTGKKKLYTRLKFSDFLLLFSESHQDKSFISAQNGHEWK